MASRFDRQDFRRLQRTLRNAKKVLPEAPAKPLERVSRIVAARAKRNIRRRTGFVRAGIDYKLSSDGLKSEVGVRKLKRNADRFYIRFLEFGTKAGPRRQRRGGKLVTINHPGTKADHPLHRAFAGAQEMLQELSAKAVREELRKITR